jgi:hypothetical protein
MVDKLKLLLAVNKANHLMYDYLDNQEKTIKAKDEQLSRCIREIAELREQLSYYTDKNQNQ